MSEVSKKVAFLKGMAEGMGLEKEEDAKSKLIARMLEAMEEMAAFSRDGFTDGYFLGQTGPEMFGTRQDEAEQYIDELDSDLGDVEEVLFADDEEDDDCGCGHHHFYDDEDDEDEDGEYDEDDEDARGDFIEYECPHCHPSVYYDQEAFDLEEEHLCPECGRELFPNAPDEEE